MEKLALMRAGLNQLRKQATFNLLCFPSAKVEILTASKTQFLKTGFPKRLRTSRRPQRHDGDLSSADRAPRTARHISDRKARQD